ncbi:MAG: GTPase ObgE [Planctomycetes bacterium]|nr:GTPase ObgE [Planctomycetota bacterium]
MFIDETEITVVSGRGGDGMSSFRREKYVPRGGPDGGDGGKGGDVVLRASRNVTTLAGIQHKRRYRAPGGGPGGTALCAGRAGEDLVIEVPVGTLVRDAKHENVLRDLAHDGDEVIVVHGGGGGRGNKHFAHATNQAPKRATEGRPGEERALKLELRLVADVGLVGLPNAGKSTFLRRVSAARPKVADYPFTTLTPVLGIVQPDDIGLVVADIPGLIEGAHAGAGLGDRFLRHVARTRVLLHLVDVLVGPEQALRDWRAIREELRLSGLGLDERPSLLAVSRIDTVEDASPVVEALAAASGGRVLAFSSQTGQGVPEVVAALLVLVRGDD